MIRTALKFGAFVVVCLVFTGYLAFTIGNLDVRDPLNRNNYTVSATFADVNGLLLNEPWQVRNRAGRPYQVFTPYLRAVMASGGRQGSGGPTARMRTALVIAEIALAMTLLVGAGLLIRSFTNLTSQSPGFDPARAIQAEISLPAER